MCCLVLYLQWSYLHYYITDTCYVACGLTFFAKLFRDTGDVSQAILALIKLWGNAFFGTFAEKLFNLLYYGVLTVTYTDL